VRPYPVELQMCQRYYQRLGSGLGNVCPIQAFLKGTSSTEFSGYVSLFTIMRILPTTLIITNSTGAITSSAVYGASLTISGQLFLYANQNATMTTLTFGNNNNFQMMLRTFSTGATGIAVHQPLELFVANGFSLDVSAEL